MYTKCLWKEYQYDAKKISKQFTVLTLILLIVFSFSGCTNKTQTTSNNYRTITDQAEREVKIPEK